MPGTQPSRAVGQAGNARPDSPAEDAWEDAPAVADRNVVRFTDRQIETMVAAVAVGVVGAAVIVGWLALRRRPSRR